MRLIVHELHIYDPYAFFILQSFVFSRVFQVAYSLNEEHLESASLSSLRRHYLAQLMVEETAVLKPDLRPNLPKQVRHLIPCPRARPSHSHQKLMIDRHRFAYVSVQMLALFCSSADEAFPWVSL